MPLYGLSLNSIYDMCIRAMDPYYGMPYYGLPLNSIYDV